MDWGIISEYVAIVEITVSVVHLQPKKHRRKQTKMWHFEIQNKQV